MSKIYKGLVKRLLSQLEIDIELDKATQLCNAFHAELSQVEPVGYANQEYVYGAECRFVVEKEFSVVKGYTHPIFTAPPSTEDL